MRIQPGETVQVEHMFLKREGEVLEVGLLKVQVRINWPCPNQIVERYRWEVKRVR